MYINKEYKWINSMKKFSIIIIIITSQKEKSNNQFEFIKV